MTPYISYAITASTEHLELERLLGFLKSKITPDDEVVIQLDSETVTSKVREVCNLYSNFDHTDCLESFAIKNCNVVEFPLNKDFATFKNNLRDVCSGVYILQLDADEIPSEVLLENIYQVANIMSYNQIDLAYLPRVNTVEGITPEYIRSQGWTVTDDGRINYPDYQGRLYKREGSVWEGKVHERLVSSKYHTILPEKYYLQHSKSFEKQIQQNNFYQTING